MINSTKYLALQVSWEENIWYFAYKTVLAQVVEWLSFGRLIPVHRSLKKSLSNTLNCKLSQYVHQCVILKKKLYSVLTFQLLNYAGRVLML